MPYLLEGLIRKGLEAHAKRLAMGSRYLPYFSHILELVIYNVLEEEASAGDDSSGE
jgi:RAB6A-GEF complex partner protein 1